MKGYVIHLPRLDDFFDPYPPRKDRNIYFIINMPLSNEKALLINQKMQTLITLLQQADENNCDFNTRINIMNVADSIGWSNNSSPIDIANFAWEDLPPTKYANWSGALLELESKLSIKQFQYSISGCLLPVIVFISANSLGNIDSEKDIIWNNKWFRRAGKIGICFDTHSHESLSSMFGNGDSILPAETADLVETLYNWIQSDPYHSHLYFEYPQAVEDESSIWSDSEW